MGALIECRNVTYTYPLSDAPAIRGLSLSVEKGTFLGVVGENGAGKTTLCAILRGFAPSFYKGELTGEVLLEGKPVLAWQGTLATKMGYVFQNPFTQISGVKGSVFEEVAYGLENFGVEEGEIERRVIEVMEMTDILSLAEKNPYELSGGQMQRVALASVIALNPEVLVIDEPTSQLDPEGTESVFKIIRALKDEQKTIVLVEHKIDLIAEYADEVLVLKGGEAKLKGPKQSILADRHLEEFGVPMPQAAKLAWKLREKGLELDHIPVTASDAKKTLANALAKGGAA